MMTRAVFFILLTVAVSPAYSQAYPSRAIRLIVPQAPGSASDNVARIIGGELSQALGQQVVVDNRPGGALTIGIDMVLKSAADGYTLGYAPIGALVIGPNMFRKVPYDVNKDLAAVAQVAFNQMLLAGSPRHPFKTVQEVIDFARQNPGKLSNASSGNGSPGHVGFELFRSMAGIRFQQVTYKGAPPTLTALLSGEIQFYLIGSAGMVVPHVKAGRLRALGVGARQRIAVLPDVPPIANTLPGYEAWGWNGILAPAGTPAPVIDRLHREIVKIVNSPEFGQVLTGEGAMAGGNTPAEFGAIIQADVRKWAKIIKEAGIRGE